MEFVALRSTPRARWLSDGALGLAVSTLGIAEVWVPFESAVGEGSPIASSVLVVLLGLAVAARRARPFGVFVAATTVGVLALALAPVHVQFWGGMVPLMILVYTVARHQGPRQAWWGMGIALLVLLVLDMSVVGLREPNDFAFRWVNAVLAFGFGRVLHRTEAAGKRSALRAQAAEATVDRAAADARAEERALIAREMHDVVAHTVSVMVVQAGAAESAVEEDPAAAREALAQIRLTGAEALDDIRRVLEILRETDDKSLLVPQPRLAGLPDLVQQFESAGTRAQLVIEGVPRPLSASLDLTAYRIVQEALTNVRRHATADHTTVCLRYGESELEVEVVDDGDGMAGEGNPAGHGILGMAERVALFGGRLDAAAGATGFRVRAVLPLGSP